MLIGILFMSSYILAYTQSEDLINFVYLPKILATAWLDIHVIANPCIFIFNNERVNQFHTPVLDNIFGLPQTFYYIDTSDANEEHANFAQYPAEYLQSLNCNGLPLSCLILKVGSAVRL